MAVPPQDPAFSLHRRIGEASLVDAVLLVKEGGDKRPVDPMAAPPQNPPISLHQRIGEASLVDAVLLIKEGGIKDPWIPWRPLLRTLPSHSIIE